MKEKLKKRRNWKSRQVVDVETDDSATKKIKLDIPDVDLHKYDNSNPLVLPSTKRNTKIIPSKDGSGGKKLSNKQRKKLEKVLEMKKKKRNRQELYEALQKVQTPAAESHLYLSTKAMQTQGLKRCFLMSFPSVEDVVQLKSVRGSRKNLNSVELVEPEPSSSDNSDESSDESIYDNVENKTVTGSSQEIISLSPLTENKSQELNNTSIPFSTDSDIKKLAKIDVIPEVSSKSARYRPVNRPDEIQESRLKLPILAEEQVVMEAVNENPVVIICGETGSGKTTQVPQFLYEAGYTNDGLMIGVTEPRRIAAITMSQRVALEMNTSTDIVSYQIRYEGNVSNKTEIKFMTDGVLLKEMQSDFLLSKYSVIILDEAHERSVFTDILIGLLSRVVPLRIKKNKPMKLIIMSATLRIEDFTGNRYLFKTPPAIVKVDARQYPVSVHFNKKTFEDYVTEAYRKVCKIHRQCSDGGILIFVTGQKEINILCKKLKRTFPMKNEEEIHKKPNHQDTELKTDTSKPAKISLFKSEINQQKVNELIIQDINLDNYSVSPMAELNDENENDDDAEFNDLSLDGDDIVMQNEIQSNSGDPEPPLYVLPLFSFLPTNKQAKVFQPPPDGCRLCVVATNVAETSITIPNIKYVVDSGKAKVRLYDKATGVSTFRIMWASKASANQRAGRAGRMGPGHCYRLYSSAVFNDEFIDFSQPEICRRPIDDVVLQLKGMNIDKVLNFPFPTAVSMQSIKAAEKRLILLGALEIPKFRKSIKDGDESCTKISPLGHAISCFPVAPRYGKMLALSNQHNLLPYVIAITAALSVPELLYEAQISFKKDGDNSEHSDGKRWMGLRKTWAGQGNSIKLGDVMVLLKAVCACEYVGFTQDYCEKYGIHYKSMCETRKLRFQLTNAINLAITSANLYIDPKMLPPTDLQAKLLRQIMLSGLPDNIAKKVNESEVTGDDECKRKWKKSYRTSNLEDPVFLHPTSVLFREMPDLVAYQEIFESNKMYMKGVTEVEPEWLITFCPDQCVFSNPLMDPEPSFDQSTGTVKCHVTATFGKWRWELPSAEIAFPEGLERMKWFARFLLNGEVCPKLKPFVGKLLSPPSTMIKSWAKLQPRTDILLQGLMVKNVYSKETLSKVWTENNKYLLEEYKSWLPESSHSELYNLWPPL